MANLLLKVGTVGPPPKWQDGDIVIALNRRRIRAVHAQHIADVRKTGFTRHGLRPMSLGQELCQRCYQYRFDRLDEEHVTRTELATGEVHVIGPSGSPLTTLAGNYMHVEEFLLRRLAYPDHRIFGTPGKEFWYGGKIDLSHAKLDLVWAQIEAETPERESDPKYRHFPFGPDDMTARVPIEVDDFDDEEMARLHAREQVQVGESLDGAPLFQDVRRRAFGVDIDTLPGVSGPDKNAIRNPTATKHLLAHGAFSRNTVVRDRRRG